MEFEKVEKKHILQGIKDFEEKGLPNGFGPSSTYDLVFEGKRYPPKAVMAYANYRATSQTPQNNFSGGGGTDCFQAFEHNGFDVVQKTDRIKNLISNYKRHISTSQLKGEIYKWELLNDFKGKPDVNAADFQEEIKSVNFGNLIYAMAIAVINQLSKEKPEALRGFFKNLFDESIDLTDRIKSFNKSTLAIYRDLGETLQHHQDERSISTYLTFHNPEKYIFYKYAYYKKFCELLGVKRAKKNEKYAHYLELVNELIENYIEPDKELINLVKSIIPEYYDGNNHLLLAQDILYQMLEKEDEVNYWIFQGNPNRYDFEKAIGEELLVNFSVSSHKNTIKTKDKVIIWLSGKYSGCYGLAEVCSEPYQRPSQKNDDLWIDENLSDLMVDIKLTHNLYDSPILKEEIDDFQELENLNIGHQGSNFRATKEEYDKFLSIVEDGSSSFEEELSKYDEADLNAFFIFLFQILDKFEIKKGDTRLHYSTKRNRISFVIGQRYSWALFKSNTNGKFWVLSKESIRPASIKFEGNLPHPFHTFIQEPNFTDIELDSIYDGFDQELNRTAKSGFRKHTDLAFEEAVFDIKFRNRFKKTQRYKTNDMILNKILFGPPGTGKTFNTVNLALEICGETIEGLDRKAIKKLYDEKIIEGQIIFSTFHQSMSYEDFIEGIKPIEPEKEGDPVVYKVVEGIFKKACIEASFNFAMDNNDTDTDKVLDFSLAYDNFIQKLEERLATESKVELEIKNGGKVYVDSISLQGNIQIKHLDGLRTYTVSKTRLSKLQKAITNLDEVSNINDTFREIIGGSNSTAYWSVLNAIQKENNLNINSNHIERTYTSEDKIEVVKELDKSIYKGNSGKPIVLIIDEINRGNVSAIFGELITLIEKDKRLGADEALLAQLPYSKEFFGVPPNLYIIGTMNTADRSVEALDSALRRRFSFIEMPPVPSCIKEFGKSKDGFIDGIDLVKLLETINKRVEKLLDRDHAIGHSYFLKIKSLKGLKAVFANKVIPLLQEYFFGDYGKIGLVLGSGFVSSIQGDADESFFATFEDYEIGSLLERKVYRIEDSLNMKDEEFKQALLHLLR